MGMQLFSPQDHREKTDEMRRKREIHAIQAILICLIKNKDPEEWIVLDPDKHKADLIGDVLDTGAFAEPSDFTSTAPLLVQRWQLYRKEVEALQDAIQAQIDWNSYCDQITPESKK